MQNSRTDNSAKTFESSSKEGLSFFIETVAGDKSIRIEQDFGHGYVRLKTSEAELRQAAQDIKCVEDAVLELLRNSRDAGAKNIFLSTTKSESTRTLCIIDDGCGIPKEMTDRVFDARVTSKLDTAHMDRWGMHGRGMALYSIKVNAKSAHVVQSESDRGCSIETVFDTNIVPEKTDQSTQPKFVKTEAGLSMRGPKNIARSVAEFAIEHTKDVNVYLGSPVEMCAALYATACNKFSKTQRIFTSQLSDSCALAYRLAFCADPKSFANVGRELGLDISERSARRIMDGDITAPLPVATSLLAATFAKKSTEIKDGAQSDAANNADQIIQNLQYGEKRTIDFAKADIDKFTLAINNAFLPLAYSYYLNDEPEIKIRQAASELVIKIALTPSE